MAARKITDEMIDRIAQWDLQGRTLRDMAVELPVSREVVRRNLKIIRAKRREYRNVNEAHFLSQLDELKQQAWRASRTPVVEKRVEETPGGNKVTITTKAPPIAAITEVRKIIEDQCRLFGMGNPKPEEADIGHIPHVVNVLVSSREELKEGIALGIFKSRLLPDLSRDGE